MSRSLSVFFSLLLVALLVGGPAAYAVYTQRTFRNFREVRAGVLYRSGQLSLDGLKRVIYDYGIKTVVSLRDAYTPGEGPPDFAEEAYCLGQEITYCRIPPRNWWAPDGSVPAEQGVQRFLEVMDCPDNYPVLVHCFAGVHRTGAYCAVYRMEYERWTNSEAIAEVKACGYSNLDDEWDILTFLEEYRPRWLAADKTPEAPELHKTFFRAGKHKKRRADRSHPPKRPARATHLLGGN
jgi:protein tyrosine phosphatase (PTP) superfamily phosphohydrolase (DUF442 family)